MARDADGRVTIRATRIDQPLRIDGVLDDGPYRSVQSISDFIQQEPDEGQPASEKTEVWIFADRDHLYIGVRCHDSQASRIVANDMRRDGRNIGQNDNLSVVIDTFYDRRNGYEFLVNAVGGMGDAQITDERDVTATGTRCGSTARSGMPAAGQRRWRFHSGRCGTGRRDAGVGHQHPAHDPLEERVRRISARCRGRRACAGS